MKQKVVVYPNSESNIVLCWVGKEFYQKDKFIKEAKSKRFSRLIDFAVPIGSPILFAQIESKKRRKASLFALGVITSYTLPSDLAEILKRTGVVEIVFNTEPEIDNRCCGVITVVGTYKIIRKDFIEQLNKAIQEYKLKHKRIPKVFANGEIVNEFNYTLKADYCMLPYRITITSAPEDFTLKLNYTTTRKKHNLVHDEKQYKLNR